MAWILDGLAEELAEDGKFYCLEYLELFMSTFGRQDYPMQPTLAVERALADALTLSAQDEDVSLEELSPLGAPTPNYDLPCPEGWALDLVHDCFAPSSYTGPCVRRKAFHKYNVAEKAEWGACVKVTPALEEHPSIVFVCLQRNFVPLLGLPPLAMDV